MTKIVVKKGQVVVKETKAIAVSGNSPADLIRMAVSGGADLDKLEKLLELQEKWEANQARKLFTSAFSSVQEKIASVIRTKLNPQTHSKYAPLENIIESAKPIYTKEGFSVIFYEGETTAQNCIRICADVLHTAGHKETYHYDVPLDGVGIQGNPNMTKIHAKASSTSYGRRYLMCMIWNIPTYDDDGQAADKPIEVQRPSALSEQKPLEKIRADFAKARKLLGDKDFLKVLGQVGYEKPEEVTNEAIALQILKDMKEVYDTRKT